MAKDKTTISTKNSVGDIENDAFMSNMTKALEKSAGVVSSYDSEIEKGINNAISSTQRGADANAARVDSAFTREQNYAANTGSTQVVAANEARRGFATNTGILKQIYQDTDKNIKDLEMRKQELIMQGNAEASDKISGLQLQAIQFRQDAAQKSYSNMLQLANFGLSAKQEQRQAQAQTFQEKSSINSIALQYGVTVSPGDTIDTIAAKAAPFASQKQQLELARMTQDIAESKARINKMISDGNTAGASAQDLYGLADSYINGGITGDMLPKMNARDGALFGKGLDIARVNKYSGDASGYSYAQKDDFILAAQKGGLTYEQAKKIADEKIVKQPSTGWFSSSSSSNYNPFTGSGATSKNALSIDSKGNWVSNGAIGGGINLPSGFKLPNKK